MTDPIPCLRDGCPGFLSGKLRQGQHYCSALCRTADVQANHLLHLIDLAKSRGDDKKIRSLAREWGYIVDLFALLDEIASLRR